MDTILFNTSRRALAKYGCGRKRKMLDRKTFGEKQLPILAMQSATQVLLPFYTRKWVLFINTQIHRRTDFSTQTEHRPNTDTQIHKI
jgi:hypothetical protein